jgi:hypothetical protein
MADPLSISMRLTAIAGAVGAAGTVVGGNVQRTAASGRPECNHRIFFQGSSDCFLSGSLSGMFLIAAW